MIRDQILPCGFYQWKNISLKLSTHVRTRNCQSVLEKQCLFLKVKNCKGLIYPILLMFSIEVFNLDKNYSYLGRKQGLRPRNLSELDVEIICQKFTQWEQANWNKDFIKCFHIMKCLSAEFEDFTYVNDFFLSKCFEAALKADSCQIDEGKTLAEAHKSMGNKFLKQENYVAALQHFSWYMGIVEKAAWKDVSPSFNYYIDACSCLRLLYIKMGELCSDPEEILANYQLAHDYAALCDNKLQIKQVSHKLGKL